MTRKPRTELFLRTDIEDALQAITTATFRALKYVPDTSDAHAYLAGVDATVQAFADAFGVERPRLPSQRPDRTGISSEWLDALPDDWKRGS